MCESEKKRGLLQVTFKYTFNTETYTKCINESEDSERFNPDGIIIAYVKSNFCYKYHPDYEFMSLEYKEKKKAENKKSNRGRHLKPKEKRKNKKNNGTNSQFGSSITFGVISDDRVHGIKIFREKSGNISKTTHYDTDEYVKGVITKLLDYINSVKPRLDMKLISTDCKLKNLICKHPLDHDSNIITWNHMMAKLEYPLAPKDRLVQYDFPLNPSAVINLHHFRRLLEIGSYNKYNKDFWGDIVVRFCFNGKNTGLTIIIRDSKKESNTEKKKFILYSLKLQYTGNLHIFGGNDIDKIEKYRDSIFGIISANKWLIQRGYKSD